MNQKKAKRIRALVRHLMTKGAITDKAWTVAGYIEHRQNKFSPSSIAADAADEVKSEPIVHRQRVLDPECGRSVYRRMKRVAVMHGKAV
jgi:hypothetical protein